MFRIGQGFDVHEFAEGRPLIIGGITIPHEKGLIGHSDADVLLHTIADACLGAIAAGDIGKHFPDTDPGNLDCTIIAQKPKMAPHIESMRKRISELLETSIDNINVKATTTEKLGFTGREEGIASQAVVLLQKK